MCPVEAAIRPPALRFQRADNDACDLVEPSDNGIPVAIRTTAMKTRTRRKTRRMADGTRGMQALIYRRPCGRTRHATVPGFAHVIDAAYSEADNQFYVAGIPALTGWTVTDSGLVETVRYDMGTTDHVAVLGLGASR